MTKKQMKQVIFMGVGCVILLIAGIIYSLLFNDARWVKNMDMFGESIEGHKYRTPYQVVKMINPNSKEDMELLREVLKNNDFDDEDE